jgi:hypothetical protein
MRFNDSCYLLMIFGVCYLVLIPGTWYLVRNILESEPGGNKEKGRWH